MACFHPRAAFRPPNGGRLSFTYHKGHTPTEIKCGHCIGCYIDASRAWATRCGHEARMHTYNSVLLLTYDDDHLPSDRNLNHQHVQLMFKRLRESALQGVEHDHSILHRRHVPEGCHEQRAIVRYHMCGEYGPTTGRPHYHISLFGIDFKDKVYYKQSPTGGKIYTSETLNKLWQQGSARINAMTWETAAYIARYNMKKAGDKNKKIVEILDPQTGEIHRRIPEYQKMSRRPGIGKPWLKQYTSDIYPRGTVIVNGAEATPPRFYDEYYKTIDPEGYEALKSNRRAEQSKRESKGLTRSRLDAEETVCKAKLSYLKRNGAL